MTKFEIKEKIDANNQIIEALLTPNKFTLNNTVAKLYQRGYKWAIKQVLKLLEENDRLQAQCPHEFENGYCIYCYKEEE